MGMNGKEAIGHAPAAPPPPPPMQALINELSMQRDIMAQRAGTFAMRLAAVEHAYSVLQGELTAAQAEIARLAELAERPKPADDRAAAPE